MYVHVPHPQSVFHGGLVILGDLWVASCFMFAPKTSVLFSFASFPLEFKWVWLQ
jgi:hypothetical protein